MAHTKEIKEKQKYKNPASRALLWAPVTQKSKKTINSSRNDLRLEVSSRFPDELIRYLEFLVSSFQALHSALHSNAPEK
jgi:hypothetical protein